MAANELEHTFKTPFAPDRISAILTKICREPFQVAHEAHDPNMLPPVHIICATFASVEDRDRLRIALHQLEKESMAAARSPHAQLRPIPVQQPAVAAR